MMLYENQKKKPATAVIWSVLIPSAGHAYAKNWGKGLLFAAGRIGLVVFAITQGIEEKQSSREESGDYYYYGEYEYRVEANSTYYVGLLGSTALGIWEMLDAAKEVKKYNRNLHNQLFPGQPYIGLHMAPMNRGGKLMLSYNF